MLSFQRECQRRANEQVKSEMSRFRERELSAMRLECENGMQDEVGKSRRQFEAFFQERLKGLQQRERNLMEAMKQREAQLDVTLFTQRQKILDELESVKSREAEAKRLLEAEDRGVRVERERLMCLEQSLKLRELSIENANKQMSIANQGVITKRQIELEREYEGKLKHIQIQEATLNEERRSLSQLETICSHQIKESADLRAQLYKLQEAIHISTESQLRAEKDNAVLTDKLERMGDYNVLKREIVRLENELFAIRHELGKNTAIHEENVRDYEARISVQRSKLQQPSSELHELRNTLANEKLGFERERIMNRQENIQLVQQLETAAHQQRCLKETLRDSQFLVKQLNQELSDLRVKTVSDKNNARANTAREATQFDSNSLKSSLRAHTYSAPMYSPPKAQPDPLHRHKSNRVRIKLPVTDTLLNESADFSLASSDISFVQEAKTSLERLEREAQELELSYKQVHSRILRGTDPSIDSSHQLYTSSIDPTAYTAQLNPIIEYGDGTKLSSLTDINLTAGINQSLLGELEKSTDIISSITTQDNFPSLPSLTQLLSLPTHTSLLSNNRDELSIVSEVTSDKQSLLGIPHTPPNELLDPIQLFHQLQHNESVCLQDTPRTSLGPEQSIKQSHQLIDSSFPTLVESNSIPGMRHPPTGIQVNTAKQPIELILPYPDAHSKDIPITPMVDNVSHANTNRILSSSSRALTRDEAVREAIEEAERIENIQAELESIPVHTNTPANPIEKVESAIIPCTIPVPTQLTSSTEPIDKVESTIIPCTTAIPTQLTSSTEPIDNVESTIIPCTIPIPTQLTSSTEPIDNVESTIIPCTIPIPTQLTSSTEPIDNVESTIIPSTTSIPLVTPDIPTQNERAIDPMAKYMQLLTSNPSLPEIEAITTKANDDVFTGLELSLKSEEQAVSFGAFSDTEKNDPFADW